MEKFSQRSFFWDKINPRADALKNNFRNDISKIKEYTRKIEELSGGTSRVTILGNSRNNNYIVKKQYVHSDRKFGKFKRTFVPEECFQSEIIALILLHGGDHFPRILYYDEKTLSIYMTYCGAKLKTINPKKYPRDWRKQFTKIYETLKAKNIYHNDFCASNLCLKGDKLYAIDFGFSKSHIDFCFKNLALEVIKKSSSFQDLLAKTKSNSNVLLNTLYLS